MKSKCPQHITQALGRWGGDSLELYDKAAHELEFMCDFDFG